MAEELVPIFYVRNGIKAIRWYARLGFTIEGEYRFAPGVPLYVCLRRGHVALHLSEHTDDARPNTLVYLYVDDLDRIVAEFNVNVKELPWGYEVQLTDPDGNRLRVGKRKALGSHE
ncbi:MAG TPA: glyoxalase superfamily protein [Nitrospira sp.]|nr:glyoxalase superfamily protein [Nitrospira sp.]